MLFPGIWIRNKKYLRGDKYMKGNVIPLRKNIRSISRKALARYHLQNIIVNCNV